jgi:glycosyltransferase involved in cell wall biosynthesis
MRVLNIVNRLGLGGIETGLLRAIPHLKKLGIEIDICCQGPKSLLDEDFEDLGCKIWRIPKSANCLRTARALEQVLDRRDYSLVHSCFGYTSGGLALGAARKGLPCAVSIHSSEPLSLYSWRNKPFLSTARKQWLAWHRRLMDKYVSMYIGHSCTNLAAFEPSWKSNQTRYRVILNGIIFPTRLDGNKQQDRESLGLPQEAPVLLHVGSFREMKNHEGLLQIFSDVLRRFPDAVLLLVGDGPLQQDVWANAQQMGILDSVRFEGSQENVWQYYRAADLFLFPSHTEGFGNALVESAVARLPIVASDIPAHRESVPDPQKKFLFPLPDYARAAELAAVQIESARAGTNDWVSASESYAREHFPIERFARDVSDAYGALVSKAA